MCDWRNGTCRLFLNRLQRIWKGKVSIVGKVKEAGERLAEFKRVGTTWHCYWETLVKEMRIENVEVGRCIMC